MASGERPLLHQSVQLAYSSSSLQQPGGVNTEEAPCGKSLQRNWREWWGKIPFTSHSLCCLLFQVTAGGSCCSQGRAVSWVTVQNRTAEYKWLVSASGPGVAARVTAVLRHRQCELQSPFQSVAWLAKPGGNGAKPAHLRLWWAGLGACRHSLQERPHHQPLQPQEGPWPSSAPVNCFFTPWRLREYCD